MVTRHSGNEPADKDVHRATDFDRQAWSLLLDHTCKQIAKTLRTANQPFLMLKGATIASWLYPDPVQRTYDDLDILIPPADEAAVVDVLGRLGYRPLLDSAALRIISPEEQPLVDRRGVTIDLHTAIKGIRRPAAEAWTVLNDRAVTWTWAGTELPTLDVAARAMNLSLHLAQLGLRDVKASQDLRLGLDQLERRLWEESAELARQLDALEAFTAGLLLLPAGISLVEHLRLEAPTDTAVLMSIDAKIFRPTVTLERILTTSWRQRAMTAWSYLFPSAAWLRHADPRAARGIWGLSLARVQRPFRVLRRTLTAFRGRYHFKRRGRSG